jgi:hypothetical protein
VKHPTATIQPPRSDQRYARAREAHPLLGAFPLAVIALAALLVVFVLTMAQLKAGSDAGARPSTSAPLVARAP